MLLSKTSKLMKAIRSDDFGFIVSVIGKKSGGFEIHAGSAPRSRMQKQVAIFVQKLLSEEMDSIIERAIRIVSESAALAETTN